MRDLEWIIKSNKEAVRRGVVAPGALQGTEGVVPTRYRVTNHDGVVLDTDLTDTQVAAKYNAIRGEVVVEDQSELTS